MSNKRVGPAALTDEQIGAVVPKHAHQQSMEIQSPPTVARDFLKLP